jgi:hypothetical protein
LHLHVHSYEHVQEQTRRHRGDDMTSNERTTAAPAAGRAADPTTGLAWRKSTVSNHQGNCVELAVLADGGVKVRNSRFPGGPHLTYTHAEMAAFVRGVQAGEFDDLLS